MNEERGISFVNIPIEVFGSKDLTANEKVLYGYLSIFKKQCCFQSNEALAEALGVSENTITNALKHLESLNYVFVEYINNNSAKRRIYVIFDNPNKLKYLLSKGYLSNSFPQGHKNCEAGHKNCDPQNRGEGHKNCDHRIIKENKIIVEPCSAVEMPNKAHGKMSDFVSIEANDQEEYERRFYERNTVRI